MTQECLVPGCGQAQHRGGFCSHHIARIPPAERAAMVRTWERLTGKPLELPEQEPPAQGELFG